MSKQNLRTDVATTTGAAIDLDDEIEPGWTADEMFGDLLGMVVGLRDDLPLLQSDKAALLRAYEALDTVYTGALKRKSD